MSATRRLIPRIRIVKMIILICALGVGLVLLLGPLWVVPVHDESGLPYYQLADHPQYASLAVAERAPQKALAIFVICMALWLTNWISLSSTGLLAVALLPTLGVVAPKQAFGYFGNSAVFFIIGVFLLAAAMIRTGLSKRLTLLFLQRFDRSPGLLLAGVTCSAAFLTLWMPEHAVAAMMFPIVLEICETLGLTKMKSAYAKSLFFGLAWGAIIGGIGTFLGGARAPLALELLRDHFQTIEGGAAYNVSFLQWMSASMPIVIVLTATSVLVLVKFMPSDVKDITPATRMLNARVAALGPMSWRERRLAVVGLATILCWIITGHSFDLGVVAILAAVLIAVLRVIDFNDAQSYVNWSVVVMYGGAIALGTALKDTHAMLWVVHTLLPEGNVNPTAVLVMMAVVSMLLSAGISNAAAVAVLLPVGFALCEQVQPNIHPMTMAYAVAIPAGLAFVLPISSPPNAICFGSGYYGVRDVFKYGMLMTAVSLVVVVLVLLFLWPLVGIQIGSEVSVAVTEFIHG